MRDSNDSRGHISLKSSNVGAEKLMQLSLALQNRCFDKLNNFFLSDNSYILSQLQKKHDEQSQDQIYEDSNY